MNCDNLQIKYSSRAFGLLNFGPINIYLVDTYLYLFMFLLCFADFNTIIKCFKRNELNIFYVRD